MDEFLIFVTEKTKFLLIAAAVFLLLEFVRPARLLQKKWRKDTLLDLVYSFTLPVLVYPASVLLSAWLVVQFWPTSINRTNMGDFRQTVTQTPMHGKVEIQPGGKFIYHPDSGFLGLDRFATTTEHNQARLSGQCNHSDFGKSLFG